ncbi:MAG TPA: alpha/beta hydrolase [Dokdonella sp.]|uniref:alpha/beta fold hydrolase n=1 Tax=Dokdonella sp. TaxID=2291710 RepID=UPI002D7FFCEC|nr:alpha/beta hydrolase [Dokdonella sp.]HET9034132.1 alpha/beta hydrolase [Dokdonella sp.]
MTASIQTDQFAHLANGIRLHYASAGERGKPLILFAHGFPEFCYAWEAQLREFGADHFAVAPDLRGFNRSDMPHEVSAYKARHLVDDLRLLAADLGYERFVLVAHDWGGAVAWSLAIALPQLLEKLIIINSPHPWLFLQALRDEPAQQQSSQYMNWLRREGSEQALMENDFTLLEGFFRNLGTTTPAWYTDEVRKRYHECWRRGLHGAVNYYRASPLHPPTDTEPGPLSLKVDPEEMRVRVSTRVIWGENDHALPKHLLDGLEQWVDDLQIVRIAEGTHWLVHEQPDRINRLIRGFLET